MKTSRIGMSVLALAFLQGGVLAAQEEGAEGGGVEVEASIALGVEDRMPVDTGTEFPADVGTLYAWTIITGAAGTTVDHVWTYGDHESVVSIDVGGSPWRVWSTKTIPEEWTGEWAFEVRDAGGAVLHFTSFMVEDAGRN